MPLGVPCHRLPVFLSSWLLSLYSCAPVTSFIRSSRPAMRPCHMSGFISVSRVGIGHFSAFAFLPMALLPYPAAAISKTFLTASALSSITVQGASLLSRFSHPGALPNSLRLSLLRPSSNLARTRSPLFLLDSWASENSITEYIKSVALRMLSRVHSRPSDIVTIINPALTRFAKSGIESSNSSRLMRSSASTSRYVPGSMSPFRMSFSSSLKAPSVLFAPVNALRPLSVKRKLSSRHPRFAHHVSAAAVCRRKLSPRAWRMLLNRL